MQLRGYQIATVNGVGAKIKEGKKRIIAQGATGSGKTPIIGAIINQAVKKSLPNWLMVPRKELMSQGSAHLDKYNIPHALIKPGHQENILFLTHIASKQTLQRRLDKIKKPPRLIIVDEAHLNLDFQKKLASRFPDAIMIGFTATPELFGGKGLSTEDHGLYDDIVYGPSIPWLAERGYLIMPDYYAPPIEGIENLHRRGTEYDEAELAALLEKNKVYGKVVEHYQKYGKVSKTSISIPGQPTAKTGQYSGKYIPSIIFCRSVALAEEAATRFQMAGFNIFAVHGGNKTHPMPVKRRDELISALRDGKIDGLTCCDLITYGVDIPRAEYSATLRPCLSRSLSFQMIGRIMRPFTMMRCHCGREYDNRTDCPSCRSMLNQNALYRKERAYWFDHVNLLKIHEDPRYPGVPFIYVPDVQWNFHGKKKRKIPPPQNEIIARKCIFQDYKICTKPASACKKCEHYIEEEDTMLFNPAAKTAVIDMELKKIEPPVVMAARPLEERREILDEIATATAKYRQSDPENPDIEAIKALLEIAKKLGRQPLWAYHKLSEHMRAVNVPALKAIQRLKGYKPGWTRWQMKRLQKN